VTLPISTPDFQENIVENRGSSVVQPHPKTEPTSMVPGSPPLCGQSHQARNNIPVSRFRGGDTCSDEMLGLVHSDLKEGIPLAPEPTSTSATPQAGP